MDSRLVVGVAPASRWMNCSCCTNIRPFHGSRSYGSRVSCAARPPTPFGRNRMKIGYKLIAEASPAGDSSARRSGRGGRLRLRRDQRPLPPLAVRAGALAFAWSMLGAIAARDRAHRARHRRHLPVIRYHPAIIAQAAATTALLSDGRFTLGVGAGERLNEHVVGQGLARRARPARAAPRGAGDHPAAVAGRLPLVRGQAPAAGGRAGLRPAGHACR